MASASDNQLLNFSQWSEATSETNGIGLRVSASVSQPDHFPGLSTLTNHMASSSGIQLGTKRTRSSSRESSPNNTHRRESRCKRQFNL